MSDRPIFVRGLSRSGGTLLTHILDRHPEIAMSYEVYEHLLDPREFTVRQKRAKLPWVRLRNRIPAGDWFIEQPNIRKFIARASRSGLSADRVLDIIRPGYEPSLAAKDFGYRCTLVEEVCQDKRVNLGKATWGAKIASRFEKLANIYPEARFIYIVRDVRDVFASRLKIGTFNQAPETVASGWERQLRSFQSFASTNQDRCVLVGYENLVKDPSTTIQDILARFGFAWDSQCLDLGAPGSTLLENPAGHLSATQVAQPINSQAVGRWRRELGLDQVAALEETAGQAISELGYEP